MIVDALPEQRTIVKWVAIVSATVTAIVVGVKAFVAGVRWIMQAGRSFGRWDAAADNWDQASDRWDTIAADIATMKENMVSADAFDELAAKVIENVRQIDAIKEDVLLLHQKVDRLTAKFSA